MCYSQRCCSQVLGNEAVVCERSEGGKVLVKVGQFEWFVNPSCFLLDGMSVDDRESDLSSDAYSDFGELY